MTTCNIERRRKETRNTDPQRRCYNGAHAKSETTWSDWETVAEGISHSRIDRQLEFWRELNDYAVNERGESARYEYRAVEQGG